MGKGRRGRGAPGHRDSPGHRLRGPLDRGRQQACRHGGAPGCGNRRRHPGERTAGEVPRDRHRGGPGQVWHRPPPGQADLRGHGRGEDRPGPRGAVRGLQGPRAPAGIPGRVLRPHAQEDRHHRDLHAEEPQGPHAHDQPLRAGEEGRDPLGGPRRVAGVFPAAPEAGDRQDPPDQGPPVRCRPPRGRGPGLRRQEACR